MGPRVGGPVRVGTLQILYYSGLSLNEGVGGAESPAVIFFPLFFACVYFLVWYIVTVTILKSLFNLLRFTTIYL